MIWAPIAWGVIREIMPQLERWVGVAHAPWWAIVGNLLVGVFAVAYLFGAGYMIARDELP